MKFISVRKVKAEWNIYLNKKWNDMMPMPTFDWNILSFTVVYDSAENRKTTYKKVTAQQESKGSQIQEVTMRDHNGDVVFHPHQNNTSPLTIKYHYPVIEMTVTDSNTLPPNTMTICLCTPMPSNSKY